MFLTLFLSNANQHNQHAAKRVNEIYFNLTFEKNTKLCDLMQLTDRLI